MATPRPRAVGIALGVLADRAFGDPARWHPVAGLGRLASRLEAVAHPPGGSARPRARGVLYTVTLVGGVTAAVGALDIAVARRPVLDTALTVATVWACLGGRSLLGVAGRHADLLEHGDVGASRARLPWLCGRDPAGLDAGQLSRAVVESVAENTSDAVVATLFWVAVAGPAGAAAHRAANTLDAMVGHRSPRHERFGWASARLDDVMGWPAARVAGLLTVVAAPLVGGHPAQVARVWARDAAAHPSPNAGVVEAACAGALGVRLGGPTPYPYGTQDRPRLGEGPPPQPADVRRAVRLMGAVQTGAAVLSVTAAVIGPQLRRRSARRSARRCSAS